MSVSLPHPPPPILTTFDRLWEPGYRERYYEQKFGVPYTDLEFRKKYVGDSERMSSGLKVFLGSQHIISRVLPGFYITTTKG